MNITLYQPVGKTHMAVWILKYLRAGCDWADMQDWYGFSNEADVQKYVEDNSILFGSLCPHDVNVELDDGEFIVIPKVGLARCQTTTKVVGHVGNIPLTATKYGEIEGLPEYDPHVAYIVSLPVYNAAKQSGRNCSDLFTVGETIRDGSTILGCRGLCQM